jgi:hypothetical protein
MSARIGLACVIALGVACARPPAPPELPELAASEVHFSLLAAGDTGRLPRLGRHFHQAQAVGIGLAAEDRRLPADALLLLGDNFYRHGLEPDDLVDRIRVNVVRPFCHFLDLSGTRSDEVSAACSEAASLRHIVPVLAVLGNHDYGHPESLHLQRDVVPRFVPNWQVAARPTLVEFPAGVSLVLADSEHVLATHEAEELERVLAQSRGPWRILAIHRPLGRARDFSGERGRREQAGYTKALLQALSRSSVTTHLVLSGDVHNLQLIEMPAPAPALQVVSGSGSDVRSVKNSNPDLRFGLAAPGFARIDLVGTGTAQRLVVSLYRTGRFPLLSRDTPELVARHSVSQAPAAAALRHHGGSQ